MLFLVELDHVKSGSVPHLNRAGLSSSKSSFPRSRAPSSWWQRGRS
jgi:hypothetical protein